MPVLLHLLDPVERTRRIGKLALETTTVQEVIRRESIAGRLPMHVWPSQNLAMVAVNTANGDVRIIDWNSCVDLIDAVAASCAVPGIWPPVTIDGERYMDGGIRSSDNVDLVSDCGIVLVLSPLGDDGPSLPGTTLKSQVEGRDRAGLQTLVMRRMKKHAARWDTTLSTARGVDLRHRLV